MKSILLIFASLFVMGTAFAGSDYYRQFHFKVDGNCSKINTVWFHQLWDLERVDLGNDSEGRMVYADIRLQLFADQTYWLGYQETAITKLISNHEWLGKTIFTGNQTGRWSVSGDKLTLSDMAVGVPLQFQLNEMTYNGVTLQFSKALNDKRILGKTIPMGFFGGNEGPNGVSINQYCHVKP